MKFRTVHGISRPEVGSTKPIDNYGSRGVSWPSLVIGNSYFLAKITANIDLLRPKHDLNSLTVGNLDQYLRNGSEKTGFLS